MNYYILDENNVVVNTIVVRDGDDPRRYGAIADPRAFGIGDTWTEPEGTGEQDIPVTWSQLAQAYREGVKDA